MIEAVFRYYAELIEAPSERVVDASAMPKLPVVNPNLTVMTMAEKCAELISGSC